MSTKPLICFMSGCRNTTAAVPKKIFLTVPRNKKRREEWFKAAGKFYVSLGGRYVCCEDHFNLEKDAKNWMFYKIMGGKIILKDDVVPVKQHTVSDSSQLCDSDIKRKQPELEKLGKSSVDDLNEPSPKSEAKESPIKQEPSETSEEDYQPLSSSAIMPHKIKPHPCFYLGLPKSEYFLITSLEKLTLQPVRNIYIVLKKIRTNDQFQKMGIDFGLSTSDVQNIFATTIPLIAKKVKQHIFWLGKKQIHQLMPPHYKVEGIIDLFEVQIERPSAPVPLAQTWNSYKNCDTVKFLVSSTPNRISFISEGFDGRALDLEIIKKSGFIDVIPKNATIVADRGFKQIDAVLAAKNVHLVRPPSVVANTKIMKSETQQTKFVAALRIQIERLFRTCREFSMLASRATINRDMVPFLDYIVVIAAALINMKLESFKT